MSADARKELLDSVRSEYKAAGKRERTRILATLEPATGYARKYLISLLSAESKAPTARRPRAPIYGPAECEAVLMAWNGANCICSKRFVSILPTFLAALQSTGQIQLSESEQARLRKISASTIDRILRSARKRRPGSPSHTTPGNLLKQQIKIRTFTEWDDVRPGFFEADLVAHSGSDPSGQFLQTLTITDIATQWTECFALLRRGELEVRIGLQDLQAVLPFPLLGLDTDNGFEFINHNLFAWCSERYITFTRGRPYKKNDQAHVEERNNTVVRKFVGYERFEGKAAQAVLARFYGLLRLYVNFFQPSSKLVFKKRTGAHVYKKHDKALTPFQRVLQSPYVEDAVKTKLQAVFDQLDPLDLLKQIRLTQAELDKHSAHALFHGKRARHARTKASLRPSSRVFEDLSKFKSTKEAVLSLPPGATIQAIDLQPRFSRGAADGVLRVLAIEGELVRIGHGVYRRSPVPPADLLELHGKKLHDATIS